MENTNINTITTANASKSPLLLKIFAWLILISGVLGLFGGGLMLFISAASGSFGLLATWGGIRLVLSIINIFVGIGLLKMRKWAFYFFFITTLISFFGLFVQAEFKTLVTFMPSLIQLLVLWYLWSIRKRFA
jgi:hypothetical protein